MGEGGGGERGEGGREGRREGGREEGREGRREREGGRWRKGEMKGGRRERKGMIKDVFRWDLRFPSNVMSHFMKKIRREKMSSQGYLIHSFKHLSKFKN